MPFFFLGNPSGHDFEFHLFSWMEVLGQWKHGIVYPRWAALAHWGYGEARFLFYPPASWTLGAALGAALPWKLAPGAYIWFALIASGFSMFVLARRWLNAKDAIFAAALYVANPYYIIIVYWRSAFAELLAGALLPLLLHFVLRAKEQGRHIIIPLAVIVAAVWLTNAPSAVMVNYSLALLIIISAILDRSPRILLYGGIAVVLGAALAAFYVLPAAYEEKWVNIAEVLSPGVRPQENFLFTTINDADHNRFNLLVSTVATAEIILIAIATWFSRMWRVQRRTAWWLLVIWTAASVLLMFSPTFIFWQHLPKLRYVQLPWRWLLCLNVGFAFLVSVGIRRWIGRALVCFAMLGVIVIAWHKIQPPWWDTAADIAEMRHAVQDGQGYEGTDEYVPAGADPYEIKKDAPQISIEDREHARFHVLKWGPEGRLFTAEVAKPGVVVLRLFNYPAWKAELNDRPVATQTQEVTGQMLIAIPAGKSEVSIALIRTWDRTLGAVISLATLIAVIALLVIQRKRARGSGADTRKSADRHRVLVATTNPGKLRDFAGAAAPHGIEIASLPELASLPPVVEDGLTFEANARKKAEHYSLYVPGQIVIADDSGLEVNALNGAPGVYSARYSADDPRAAGPNTDDEANNARLLRELKNIAPERRTARFVCVIAAARDGKTVAVCRGQADGTIVDTPRGSEGFGYDPLFFYPPIQKTFAEIPAREKARYSHRGAAFRKFLDWYGAQWAISDQEIHKGRKGRKESPQS
ncbi:MAG TPA: RdgB/HAM1 family non-canonical purine NTP pyrophosphatase [Terriglobales bacterium]|nr:RdgB/HAM1 family non-canonical purine NTP pyrophosphatase [Terriglobales bacterium]